MTCCCHLCKISYRPTRTYVLPTMTSSSTHCISVICERNNCTNTFCSSGDTFIMHAEEKYGVPLKWNRDDLQVGHLIFFFMCQECNRFCILDLSCSTTFILCLLMTLRWYQEKEWATELQLHASTELAGKCSDGWLAAAREEFLMLVGIWRVRTSCAIKYYNEFMLVCI
jgi:hypothetical protein